MWPQYICLLVILLLKCLCYIFLKFHCQSIISSLAPCNRAGCRFTHYQKKIQTLFRHLTIILLNMEGSVDILWSIWLSFTFLFITWQVVDAHFPQHFFENLSFSYLPPRSMVGCGRWPADPRGRRRAGGSGWWQVLLEWRSGPCCGTGSGNL